jgi:hypothetical protein
MTGSRIDIARRIATLRQEASELRVLANAATSHGVRLLLNTEAYDREDQATALEEWLNGTAPGGGAIDRNEDREKKGTAAQ